MHAPLNKSNSKVIVHIIFIFVYIRQLRTTHNKHINHENFTIWWIFSFVLRSLDTIIKF